MPKSGEHRVNQIDSFFRVRPSSQNIREGESVSFLEDGKLVKQEKRNGVVYEQVFVEQNKIKQAPVQTTGDVTNLIVQGSSSGSGDITGITAGTGLTGDGSSGNITLNVVGGTGITANANDIAIDSTVVTLTGSQTLTNKTLTAPTFTGTAQGANLTLTGDLTVGGTTTTLNTQNLQVKDKNIVLNYLDGDASSSADGAGITIQDAVNSSTDATILWDNSSPTNSPGEFDFSHSINVTGNISVSGTVDGRDLATDGSKLDGIETNATADQTASDIRGLGFFDTSNDGATSGLDSDLLDGQHGNYYLDFDNFLIDNDQIPIAKLASDSVSYGGVSVTLGSSDATPAFDLSDATSLPIVAGTSGTLSVARGGTGATSLNDLITLGTHTTGNYVATVADSGTGGITVANSGSESAAVTLELDVNGLTAATLASGDFLAFSDESATGDPTKKESIDDIATLFAGTGLTASSAVINLDISNLNPINEAQTAAASDTILIYDYDATEHKQMTLEDLEDAIGGTGTVTNIATENGITGGSITSTGTLGLDFSTLTDMTGDISGSTEFILQNGTTESRKAASEIKLSYFNNNSNWTSNAGTVTSITVTGGNGLTGGGSAITSSGSVTLAVGSDTLSVGADKVDIALSALTAVSEVQGSDGFIFFDGSDSDNARAGTVSDLPFTNNSGTVTSIATGTGLTGGTITSSGTISLTNHSGDLITSGTVAADRIANLAASKITSGTFDTARIPSTIFKENLGTLTGGTDTENAKATGLYRVDETGHSTLLVSFTGVSGSTRSLELYAHYSDELYFRTGRDSETNFDSIGRYGNKIFHSNNSTSITSVGTISTGTWQGTAIAAAYVGSLPASKITSGAFDMDRLPTKDEDDMASDSADHIPTQQSVKAYVDANSNSGDITGITTATTSGLTGGTTSGTATLVVDYLPATDDRDVKPNAITTSGRKQVRAYFATLEGLTGSSGSDYQDLLVLDTYSDSTGGDVNALAFDKSTQNIYHYLAEQSASSWGTPKRIAYIENGSNNRVMTATNSSTVRGEGNLTFDGSTLAVTGALTTSSTITATGNITTSAGHLVLPYGEINDSGTDMNLVSTNALTLGTESGTALTFANASLRGVFADDVSIPVAKRLYFGASDHTYISEDQNDRLRFFCGGNEFMRFNESTTDTLTLYADNAARAQITETGLKVVSGAIGVNINALGDNGSIVATNDIIAGQGGGSVAMTINDGGGNANLTFNHRNKTPDQDGNSGRIEVNVDSSGGAYMAFEVASNVTSGSSVSTSEKLRIDDAGVDINGNILTGNASNPSIEIRNTATSAGSGPALIFGHSQSGTSSVAKIDTHLTDGSEGGRAGHLDFHTSQGGTMSQKFRIDSDGSLIMNAAEKFYLDGKGNTYIFEESSDNVVHYVGGQNKMRFNSTGAIFNDGSLDLDFRVESNGDSNMLFVDGGNNRVGIGTGSPDSELHVSNNTANLKIESTGSGNASYLHIKGTTNQYDLFNNAGDFQIDENGVATRFVIKDSTGNVGISEDSPDTKLHIKTTGSGSTSLLKLEDNARLMFLGRDAIAVQDLSGSAAQLYINSNTTFSGTATIPSVRITSGSGNAFTLGEVSGELRMKGNGNSEFNFLATSNGFAGLNAGTYQSATGYFQSDDYSTNLNLRRGPNNDDRITIEASHTDIVGDANTRARFGSTIFLYKPTHINHQLYGGFGAQTTGGTTDWNYSENARSGNGYTLLLSTATNGPGTTTVNTGNNSYYHTLSFEYASWDSDANMTQIGIPYYFANNDGVRPVIRSRYSGTWSAYNSLITGNANGQIQGHPGTESLPSYSFNGGGVSDLDTGMYRRTTNQIGFTCAGEDQMHIADGTVFIEQPVKIQFANDQRIFDNGSGGLKIGAASHELQFYAGGSDPMQFYTGGVSGTERIRLESGGDCHFDQDVIAFSTTPSDKRLKTNIKEINYGLETIMKLNPKEYDWKKDNRHDIGFIAQEVEEVIPEIVKDKKHFDENIKTLDYEKLTAVLIKAVQEQQQQINELKEKLNG